VVSNDSPASQTRSLTTSPSRIDLHTHTTASDGELEPAELVARAVGLGIQVLAITDHDTTAGVAAALSAARGQPITVVPGVEISTVSGREEIHLLGYCLDLENPELQSVLARTQQARWQRAREMLARLANLGLTVEWERLIELTGGGASIGRPHVAASLLEAGLVSSYDEAFRMWIGRDCPAYVERYKLSPEEAIRLVRRSGGLPVLAHPYIYSRRGEIRHSLDLKRWLPRLRAAGLAGIEVYCANYPRHASRHLLDLAVRHRLLVTGGSDFHSTLFGSGLGGVAVPWAVWEGLQRRHRQARARLAR